jgi:Skp family chaperone for outer membrane proteins
MDCQYCKKTFSSKSSLNNHRKTAKYCLKLQDSNMEIVNFNCEYCDKSFTTKQPLSTHLTICKEKKFQEKHKELQGELQEKLSKKDKELQEKLSKKDKELQEKLSKKDKELQEKDILIAELRVELRTYKDDHEFIKRMAEKPKTVTNNNTLNITTSIDFNDLDKVKNVIENKLDIKDVIDGQKGLARFVKNNLLTDDNGSLNYKCSDSSRCMFKYKDISGEIKKDLEAKKLTEYILNGGIRSRSADIGNEWCKDDDGDINMTKFDIMLEQQQSIMKLSDDNTSFKKELASITS